VAFSSTASNLVPGDSGGIEDIFLRDRDATGFTSLCHPGENGVRTCPCGNPPASPGRGCDNSAATGGAYLSANGFAYLSSDSIAFTTYAEKPTALSVLMQGDTFASAGIVYGQGVRCVGGSLLRLYAKSASLGSVTMPGPGDPTVSARSAAKGDVIQPGESRLVPRLLPRSRRARRMPVEPDVQHDADGGSDLAAVKYRARAVSCRFAANRKETARARYFTVAT
jgi:hypothetical protein